jgi:hypothetical protein
MPLKYRLLPLTVLLILSLPIIVSAQTTTYARVIALTANLREAPSVSSANQEEIPEGVLVKVLDEKRPWYVVRVRDRVGWMHGNTLEFIGIQDSLPQTPHKQIVAPDYRRSPTSVPRRASPPDTPSRTTGADRGYIRGPRGGCYYFSGSGRKVYVDRSLCN